MARYRDMDRARSELEKQLKDKGGGDKTAANRASAAKTRFKKSSRNPGLSG